jgi:hypothetical protein
MKLGRRDLNSILAVAVSGVLAGGMVSCTKESAPGGGGTEKPAAPPKAAPPASEEKHACKGQNSCANKGGCSTGDKGCAGKNSCKGKGGCAVPHT